MRQNLFIIVLVAVLVSELVYWPVFAQQSWQNRYLPQVGAGKSSSFRPDKSSSTGFEQQDAAGGAQIPEISGQMMIPPELQVLQYQVHVVGEVTRPGTYRVPASERVSEVIKRAGGINEEGSKRNVQIKRKGATVNNVDLIRFELYGDLKNNPFIMDNDVVYVPLRKGAVQIVGAVRRPLIYELGGETSVKEMIDLAGGYNSGIDVSEPVRVIRFENSEKKVYEVSNNDLDLSQFGIKNGDVVVIPSIITSKHKFDYNVATVPGDKVFYPSYEDRVFVLGGVNAPGAYDWNPYYTVHQYITMAGGVTQLSKNKMVIISAEGKRRTLKINKGINEQVNPGDTIMVGHKRLAPEFWVNMFMAFAGFGLSATATAITLTNR